MSDIVETLRECAEDSRKTEGDYYADQFSTDASVFDDAADEIERLRRQVSQQENSTNCPHVVGKTTQHCSLTPFTLTDEERDAVELAAGDYLYHQDPGGRAQHIRETLLGLLERLK